MERESLYHRLRQQLRYIPIVFAAYIKMYRSILFQIENRAVGFGQTQLRALLVNA